MPRSHGVLKVEVWEAASDFRRLPLEAQWAYAMLLSQPQINNLGVLPYVPEKWWRFAQGLDRGRLDDLLELLEQQRYTITDVETGELLVRTFIRHDGVWKVPKLVTNARKLWRETESQRIREYLAERHPWLVDATWTRERIEQHELTPRPPETPTDTPSVTGTDTPSVTPIADPVDNDEERGSDTPTDTGISPRARARDGLPRSQGQPPPQGRSEGPTAAAEPAREPSLRDDRTDAAAAETIERLQALGLDTDELLTVHPLDLVTQWLDVATHEAERNPAGFVIAGLASGQPPSPRGKPAAATPSTVSLLEKARGLYQRTRDEEAVADWLAGITRLTPTDRERILEQATT